MSPRRRRRTRLSRYDDLPALRYARGIADGQIIGCEKIRLACQRFLDELEQSEHDWYPYAFDPERYLRVVEFNERLLRPTKGGYSHLTLTDWQHFVDANLYGWVRKTDGYRRYSEGMVLIGRGNGKSTWEIGNALYAASKDNEPGAEVYMLANTKDQISHMYDETRNMIDQSPVLCRHFRATRRAIYYDSTYSVIQHLVSDARVLDGLNAHLAIFDEIHAYRDFELINVIRRSISKRRQGMVQYISTMGTVLDGPLMDLYGLADSVLKNTADELVAGRFFAAVYELDAGDDPEDYTQWVKANPSIGTLLDLETLRAEWARARISPQERADFLTKQLNIFVNAGEASYIEWEVIQRNRGIIDPAMLNGMECYGGFDLSSTEDFTAAALVFPMDDGRIYVTVHSWVPETKASANMEHIDYYQWALKGDLTICPGDHIEQDSVLEWFEEQAKRYEIISIGYDPANAPFFVRRLNNAGLNTNVVRQGPLTLNGPMKDLRERLLNGQIVYNNNDMIRWYLGNVKLRQSFYDRAQNNWMPTKQGRYKKIDGFMAWLFAHTELIRHAPVEDPGRPINIQAYSI